MIGPRNSPWTAFPPSQARAFSRWAPAAELSRCLRLKAEPELVVSVDISPDSARNIAFNFGARRLSNAYVIQGDVLAAISHKFDFIFFNAPYYGERPKDWLERAVTDENYDTLKRFLGDVKRCLAVDGVVMLGFYKAREPLLRAELQRAGLQVVSVREERRWAYRCKYFMLSAA